MKKLIFSISFVLLALCMTTVCSYAQTNNSVLNEMGNNIKNVVGGAENTVEDAAKGTTNAVKNGTENLKNGMQNMGNAMGNTMNDAGNYTASRTAADGGTATGMMGTETWSWIIIGVVAIAIIALFWYYASRTRNNRNDH